MAGEPSFYELGCEGWEVAGLIDLPGDMRAAASALDQDIRATMVDVDHNRSRIPSDVASGWDSYVKEWAHFTGQDQGPGQGWLFGSGLTAWASASAVGMDGIVQRRQQLQSWRDRIKQYIGPLSAPDPKKPASDPSTPFLGVDWEKVALYGGGLLVGGLVLYGVGRYAVGSFVKGK